MRKKMAFLVVLAVCPPGVRGEEIRAYVRRHRESTEAVVASVLRSPCDRRFMSADFWGRGLGNSVNTPLNALAFAVATNRTMLLSVDKQYEAGFWRYLGDVRWPRKDRVLDAFRRAGGCARCGCDDDETVRDFFPLSARCLQDDSCGNGVRWLLCDDGLRQETAPFVHVRGAVTWLAHLGGFHLQKDAWGKLYDALVDPQPLVHSGDAASLPLAPVLRRKLGRLSDGLYDLGVHVRHRQYQPVDDIERNAAACVAEAIAAANSRRRTKPVTTVFVATELPSRIPNVVDAIRREVEALKKGGSSSSLTFDFLNVSEVPERDALRRVARTNARAVRRDWGEHAHERWLSAADFYLLASSRLVVGTLSSTFSELAAAAVHRNSRTFLYDPIFQVTGPERSQPQKRKWPADDEYLTDYGPHFKCIRADDDWPLPQYVKLRPSFAAKWKALHCPTTTTEEKKEKKKKDQPATSDMRTP